MSHKVRAKEDVGLRQAPPNATVQRPAPPTAPSASSSEIQRTTQRQLSNAIARSARLPTNTSAASTLSPSRMKASGIPRSTTTASSARLDALAYSREMLQAKPLERQGQPLSTGTTKQDRGSQPSNRSPLQSNPYQTHANYGHVKRAFQNSPGTTTSSLDQDQNSVLGISFPQKYKELHTTLPPRLIPELRALAAAVPIPTTTARSFGSSSSPSTRFTESPAPWSASTTTTPTSWSSTSPSIGHPYKLTVGNNKRSQTVPLPTGTRSRLLKLPVLPEANIRPSSRNDARLNEEERGTLPTTPKKRTPLNTPAPTPPPRSSSIKRMLSRKDSRPRTPNAATLNLPPTPEPESSPLASRSFPRVEELGSSLQRLWNDPILDEVDRSSQLSSPPGFGRGIEPSYAERTIVADKKFVASETPTKVETSGNHQRRLLKPVEIQATAPVISSGALKVPREHRQDPDVHDQHAATRNTSSRLNKFSRLAFFGRNSKSTPPEVERAPRKLQRKGPAAGTGHEGYSKHSRRGRTSSVEGAATSTDSDRSVSSVGRRTLRSFSRKRSSSSRRDSSSQSDLDDFVAPRLIPVAMIGGSQRGIHGLLSSEEASQAAVQTYDRKLDNSTPRTIDSASTSIPTITNSPTASLDDLIPPLKALRRSQRPEHDLGSFPIPPPHQTEFHAEAYMESYHTNQASGLISNVPALSSQLDVHRIDSRLPKKREQKSRRHRWNIFKRRDDSDVASLQHLPARSAPPEMSVSVATVSTPRPMPYYAMMESENDLSVVETIDRYLYQADESPLVSPIGRMHQNLDSQEPEQSRVHSSQLPSASILASTGSPFIRPISPKSLPPELGKVSPFVSRQDVRQPRLAQVGRIPKVIPRSEREHKPNRTSFSRPFQPSEDDGETVRNLPVLTLQTAFDRPAPGSDATVVSIKNVDHLEVASSASLQAQSMPQVSRQLTSGNAEFLRFGSRHGSEFSISNSSDGMTSASGPTVLLRDASKGTAYRHTVGEDEVWNEYDDFIDDVMSPPWARGEKADRSRVPNAHEEGNHSMLLGLVAMQSQSQPRPLPSVAFRRPQDASVATMFSAEPGAGDDLRLRRSRIISALHSSVDLTSPFLIEHLLAGESEENRRSDKFSDRISGSTATTSAYLSPSPYAISELPAHYGEQHRYEHATSFDVVERGKDPAAQSELHYASLMVSRWLSFGRVLFSPAHEEIHTLQERHVLVIDGLGSEDWSIYCAVTYQAEKAYVHDLKERQHSRTPPARRKSEHSPPNHRRAEIANFNDQFPFPPAFFAAAVLRFPPAMSESKIQNILTECRRVLVPGGHLELMLLDLDIVNMGVQTRRAVRDLKIRMATSDREVSLKPIIDNVQTVLGGRGFSNLSRCIVGVPVAGGPAGSLDSSSSSRSSRESYRQHRRSNTESKQQMAFSGKSNQHQHLGHNFSLNDLVADHSENADAKISKVVSRTARNWWQHCFEAAVIPDGNLARSIFADKQVLKECKARASSFKLLIAYTQKPVFETKRRTMSEPAMPTLATTGIERAPRTAF